MQQIANWIYKTYPNSAQLIWGPGPLLFNVGGQKISDQAQLRNQVYASDLPGHYDHVHWASDVPISSDGKMVSMAGGSAGGALAAFSMTDTAKALWDDEVKKIPAYQGGSGLFDRAVPKIRKTMEEKVWGFAKAQADKLMVGPASPSGAGAERWRPMLIKAFKFQGEEPRKDRVDALIRQIWTESKGDPNIAQQIVDQNGTGESAGVGLYQVIPTTWEGFRDRRLSADRRDPWAQNNFAVRYFRDRHHWDTSFVGQGHGWKSGGVLPDNLPKALLYDNGGYLPDGATATNQSGKPEPVFSHSQWQTIKASMWSKAQAGDFRGLVDELGNLAGALRDVVAKVDWRDIGAKTSTTFNEKFREGQLADIRSVFGLPDYESIPFVKAQKELEDARKESADSAASSAQSADSAAVSADRAEAASQGAPMPVAASRVSSPVDVGAEIAKTGSLVAAAVAAPNPATVGAAALGAGQTINFIVQNQEAAMQEYRKWQAKNNRGLVGAR